MEQYYEDDWMQSYNSKIVHPFNPKPENFTIETVAHALSLKTRFNGQCNFHYSVAQHSVIVSKFCASENALWGLLHELDEVFLPDIPRPIKRKLPGWKEVANKHMIAGAKAFGLKQPMPDEIHYFDAAALNTEKFYIMSESPKPWGDLPPKLDTIIRPMTWQEAKQEFIDRYNELTK